jgi:oligoendopeptidase F
MQRGFVARHHKPFTGSQGLHVEQGLVVAQCRIAQLGALQLWLIGLEKGEKTAIDYYMKGLSLGGSKPLPELFKASGLEFNFGPSIIQRLADRVQKELEKLPE